jgi:hypothetical protein
MAATTREVRILDHTERVHPDQNMSTAWRWGPRWEAGERRGTWVVSRINIASGPVAIRLEFDESPLLAWDRFSERLEDLRSGCLEVDEQLRAETTPEAPANRGGELTWQAFAEARTVIYRRDVLARGGRLTDGTGPVPFLLDPITPVTVAAGAWFLPRPGSESATRWHLFTGDLSWSAAATAPAMTAACRWVDSPNHDMRTADVAPDGMACRRCLAASDPE